MPGERPQPGRRAVGARRGQRHGRRAGAARWRTRRNHQPSTRRRRHVPSRQPRRWAHQPGGDGPMRILICEDSVLLREGLVRLLADARRQVVAALPDTHGLMDAVTEKDPELCILDVRLPPTFTDEGIRAALELRAAHPSVPLLVLSQYVEERYASELISAHSGSAHGGAL